MFNNSFDFLDQINNFKIEKICSTIESLNNNFNKNDEIILYVNIRSLNANSNELEILIESLSIKPFYIICTETWQIKNSNFFEIQGYNMYYSEGELSIADGIVIYVRNDINETTEVIAVDKLKIIHTNITLNNSKSLQISSLYRSHQLPEITFINSLKKFLNENKNIKNHYIIGDFNINILETNMISQEFLNNFLELGFIPGFQMITRTSSVKTDKGTCIDNIFFKTESIETSTYTLTNSITDHYTLSAKIKKKFISI